jgi:hypothetical protein
MPWPWTLANRVFWGDCILMLATTGSSSDATVVYFHPPMAFDREATKALAAELADKGVFIGTSSWKYEGWMGQLYSPQRYEYRGKILQPHA